MALVVELSEPPAEHFMVSRVRSQMSGTILQYPGSADSRCRGSSPSRVVAAIRGLPLISRVAVFDRVLPLFEVLVRQSLELLVWCYTAISPGSAGGCERSNSSDFRCVADCWRV